MMNVVQLRIPQNVTIQNVISQLACRILESIKREFDSDEPLFENPDSMEQAFSGYLTAYDLCGSDPICSNGIEKLYEAKNDIYPLEIRHGLD